ncbi:MAG: hypothetical protein U1F53_20325 [Burkholderiaceae bacterium]
MQDFEFVADEVGVLRVLLKNAAAAKAAGVNVLLYGPLGTGRPSWPRSAPRPD